MMNGIDLFICLPRGDWIRLGVPRRRFVDGELLADECEMSVDKKTQLFFH